MKNLLLIRRKYIFFIGIETIRIGSQKLTISLHQVIFLTGCSNNEGVMEENNLPKRWQSQSVKIFQVARKVHAQSVVQCGLKNKQPTGSINVQVSLKKVYIWNIFHPLKNDLHTRVPTYHFSFDFKVLSQEPHKPHFII